MSEFSRRDFVKSSLVTAGGIGISSSMAGSAWDISAVPMMIYEWQ